jgi:leader peptidase (prepilin peptidase) / N-methyltransferase
VIIVHELAGSSTLYRTITSSLSWQTLGFVIVYLAAAIPAVMGTTHEAAFIGASIVLGAALILLSAIDIRFLRLPNALTLPLLVVGLVFCVVFQWDDVRWRIAAAAFGFGILYGVAKLYFYLRGRHGLGLGDAKLLAASGAWLGLEGVPSTLLIASVSALGVALAGQLAGRPIARNTRVPFGPFLALGTWLTWFYGPMI